MPEPEASTAAASVSVIICAYTEERWQDICDAVDSVLRQDSPVDEVLLVIDNNDELFERASRRYPHGTGPTVLRNSHTPGLSGARNTGIHAATSEVVAFLDDDARADPDWSQRLVAHYADPDVDGVGGHATPRWPDARPAWMPAEFDWVVGCSYVGQPVVLSPVRNFLGCNMSMRREVVASLGGFDPSVGRIGKTPTGCDETELCIRIRRRRPQAQLLLDPLVRVRHTVSPDRTRFRYFARRCYHEGLSKAVVSRLVGAGDALSSERTYVAKVLPRAVGRGLLSGTPAGLGRAAAVVVGLALTCAGYAVGRVRTSLQRP